MSKLRLRVSVLLVGCSRAAPSPVVDAEVAAAPAPSASFEKAALLDVRALAPAGDVWKCVYARCARTCVYPRMARVPEGKPSTLPPCIEQPKAFCFAATMTSGGPNVACYATRDGCEAERARSSSELPPPTGCEEI